MDACKIFCRRVNRAGVLRGSALTKGIKKKGEILMAIAPILKPTSNYYGRLICCKCKEHITTEDLLSYNGNIYCLSCKEKAIRLYQRDLKASQSPEWTKFKAACENAFLEAMEAAQTTDDGGTCNMDSTFITWPRVNEAAFTMVMDQACLSGWKTKWLGSTGIMITPPNVGQADKRCKAAETVTKVFKEFGYSASTWYQMD